MGPKCFECHSERVVDFSASCPDGCVIYLGENISHTGDLPSDINIGDTNEVAFEFCLDCGKIQADFPVETTLEDAEGDE